MSDPKVNTDKINQSIIPAPKEYTLYYGSDFIINDSKAFCPECQIVFYAYLDEADIILLQHYGIKRPRPHACMP
jgi:hypothetical protein